ncbi:hypothetical protein D3C80_1424720 [compost metagenome]
MPLVAIVRVPTPTMTALEPAVKVPVTPDTLKLATVRVLSTSLSLPSTLPLAGLSSATVLVSGATTDASSTGVTVMFSVLSLPVLVV